MVKIYTKKPIPHTQKLKRFKLSQLRAILLIGVFAFASCCFVFEFQGSNESSKNDIIDIINFAVNPNPNSSDNSTSEIIDTGKTKEKDGNHAHTQGSEISTDIQSQPKHTDSISEIEEESKVPSGEDVSGPTAKDDAPVTDSQVEIEQPVKNESSNSNSDASQEEASDNSTSKQSPDEVTTTNNTNNNTKSSSQEVADGSKQNSPIINATSVTINVTNNATMNITTAVDVTTTSTSTINIKNETEKKALMCAIVKDEEAYIDEWVDYHHALGFDRFRIFDNSEKFEMKQWGDKKGDHIEMVHWPEVGTQKMAYLDCALRELRLKNAATWVAFFDVDEFLVLRKHDNLHDFLEEHLQSGALGINWIVMTPTEEDLLYSPLPVTKRFQHHQTRSRSHMKTILKLSDMNTSKRGTKGLHKFRLKNATEGTHDTRGNYFSGVFNPWGPPHDVATLYHFHTKSYKEYVAKRLRGRAAKEVYPENNPKLDDAREDFDKAITAAAQRNSTTNVTINPGQGFDDSVWKAMKKFVPKYAIFDNEEWSLGTQVSFDSNSTNTNTTKKKAIMCAIVKDEEAYIDEWVDYHHALGFDHFHIYDNSEKFEMKQWGDKKGGHVEVTHWPKVGKQKFANLDCAQKAVDGEYTWVAFFDIDEFLVLRKHDNLHNFLEEHLQSGSLAINWIIMKPTEEDLLYSPLPVTKRFQYRDRANIRRFKSITKLDDMHMSTAGVHKFRLKDNTKGTHDTKGRHFHEHYNIYGGKYDVAVLYHFHTKSYKEYVAKRLRGRAAAVVDPNNNPKLDDAREDFDKAITAAAQRNSTTNVTIAAELDFDDSAWQAVKKFVPKYANFDNEEWRR